MKLAEYLAEYIDDIDTARVGGINPEDMSEVIQAGLEAFVATSEDAIVIADDGSYREEYV